MFRRKKAVIRFRDRAEAGRCLAERLRHLTGTNSVVFALPRGGVPVGMPIAEALGAPLDLLLVRKIGAPGQPELALGAVVDGEPPQTVLNDQIIKCLSVPPGFIAQEVNRQLEECERRRHLWMRGRSPIVPFGSTVILVDDGIATGATARAAILAIRRTAAARLVLAVPVISYEVAETLRPLCDQVLFLVEPHQLGSVGAFYDDFHQLTDEEMIGLLQNGLVWGRQDEHTGDPR
ncbi:phosphoribosyltransferase [Dankookia rubra]|uniref:Phosphoribosyltransferase n=1 Tax=Dankookia rubra TaxID=1442381 RepID=A0A4R5QKE6_9PROT|nr:phosphoribosyltransferase family protein [Dankookia rubra]TDH63299.1 phosphoribosyltransferase [Dankookia rubra]